MIHKETLSFIVLLVLMAITASARADVLQNEVNCSFTNQEVSVIASDLAKQSGVEILVDPALKGLITIEMGKVPLEKAVEQLAIITGGFPGFFGGRIYLASKDPAGPYYLSVMETRVIPIGYLGVAQILQYLGKNPILVYLTADEASNSISITAPRSIADYAEAVIRSLDIRQFQVQVEASVVDDSSVDTQDKGVQFKWPISLGPPNSEGVYSISYAGTIFGVTNPSDGLKLFNLFNYNSKDKLKIMAQPSVVVQDKKTANLGVGRAFYAGTGSTLGSPPAKYEKITTGISLKVTPRVIINADGSKNILVDTEADLSDVVSTGTGNISVTTNSRTVKTTLSVKNGETIIIGGLESNTDYWIKSKVPGLGDIPLIGNLFRTSRKEIRQQKVTILITARVVEPEKAVKEAKPAKTEVDIRKPEIGVPTLPIEPDTP